MYDTGEPAKWKYVRQMNSPRGRHCTVVFQNLIYAIGGEDTAEEPLNTAEYYDPMIDCWMQLPPMRIGRCDFGKPTPPNSAINFIFILVM